MDLDEAIGHITTASRVSFIIGAGASIGAGIPLASGIVKLVHEKFQHCVASLPEAERHDYGRVMGSLDPGERRELIQPLLENAKLNWGHIALASAIPHINLSRILSFNFDLLVEQAASLLSLQMPVYDFGGVS